VTPAKGTLFMSPTPTLEPNIHSPHFSLSTPMNNIPSSGSPSLEDRKPLISPDPSPPSTLRHSHDPLFLQSTTRLNRPSYTLRSRCTIPRGTHFPVHGRC
jgi:hypothetical protein